MSQKEFDQFKHKIKDWMNTHPEEYDCFEEEMNRKDNKGYQKILVEAFKLIPSYKKVVKKRANEGFYNDISDIERIAENNKLAELLIKSIENIPENSIIPAMLAWLYYGKSVERMVERGEEIRKHPKTGYIQKLLIASTIKIIISKSIDLGLRTKKDWQEHKKLMQIVDENKVMDWAVENLPDEKKKSGRKSRQQTLPEMLSSSVIQKPENLITRIENFLKSKNSKRDIACLKIALEELHYIYSCEVRTFRDALEKQYGNTIRIISERGIQDAYKELNEFMGEGRQVKDLNENREYIEEVKALLSD